MRKLFFLLAVALTVGVGCIETDIKPMTDDELAREYFKPFPYPIDDVNPSKPTFTPKADTTGRGRNPATGKTMTISAKNPV